MSVQSGKSDATGANTATLAKGPDPLLRKGPNDDLLLTDYVEWNGPNPNLRSGQDKKLSKGPNLQLQKGPQGKSIGANPANRKGPQVVTLKRCVTAGSTLDAASTRSC